MDNKTPIYGLVLLGLYAGAFTWIKNNGNFATNPFYVPSGAMVEFIRRTISETSYWVYKNKVIENYKNGATWYRIWTNGFIEQGGRVTNPDKNPVLGEALSYTFSIAFKDTNYKFQPTPVMVNWTGFNAAYLNWMYTKYTTYATTTKENNYYIPYVDWEARGW